MCRIMDTIPEATLLLKSDSIEITVTNRIWNHTKAVIKVRFTIILNPTLITKNNVNL